MNVARFNFSHGTHEDPARRLAQLQKLRDELDMPVAALLDTKGPAPELSAPEAAGRTQPAGAGAAFRRHRSGP